MCVMTVLHAVLDAARDVHLWAEDDAGDVEGTPPAERGLPAESDGFDHPFAARSVAIETVAGQVAEYRLADPGLALTLPTQAAGPLASNVARDGGDDRDVAWASWRVPTARIEPAEAFDLLLAFPERPDTPLGSSIRFFARVALLATELVARGRYLPTSDATSGRARARARVGWSIAPGAGDEARIDTLAAAMPGACLAADAAMADFETARRAVLDVVDKFVDALVVQQAADLDTTRWPRERSDPSSARTVARGSSTADRPIPNAVQAP